MSPRAAEPGRRPATSGLELAGRVHGVALHGRLPEEFLPYLGRRRENAAAAAEERPSSASAANSVEEGDGPAPPPMPADPPAQQEPRERRGLELIYRPAASLPRVQPLWTSTPASPGTTPERFSVFALPGGFGLAVEGGVQGHFRASGDRLEIHGLDEPTAAPHLLFSYALPLWLETRGVPVLHGSAVTLGETAVGFLGPSGTGKSVLAAELVRCGCGFLSDDGLALVRDAGEEGEEGWRCPSGPPLLRLWPSGIEGRLEMAAGGLQRVGFGSDKRRLAPAELLGQTGAPPAARCRREAPGATPRLAALYRLRRRPAGAGPVTVTPIPPPQALLHLLEHGVAAAPAAALGLAGGRLDRLARVAEEVPFRQLDYPSGGSTAAVLEALQADGALSGRG